MGRLLLFFLFSFAACGVVTLVRTPDNAGDAPALQTIAVALGSNSTSGNLILGVFGGVTTLCGTGSPTVSDSLGTLYSVILKTQNTTGNTSWVLYGYAAGTGANTVTVDFGVAITCTNRLLTVAEYSGAGVLDVSKTATGLGTAVDTGAKNTTNADDLLFCGARTFDISRTFTAGKYDVTSFYVIRFQTGSVASQAVADATVSATGAYYCRMTISSSTRWIAFFLAFKASTTTTTYRRRVVTAQ